MLTFRILLLLGVAQLAASVEIWDIIQTTWDRSKLFTRIPLSSPIKFTSPGPIGDADIVVDDTTTHQSMLGYGAALTDSSAQILSNLKAQNFANYWSILGHMFVPTDGADAAGLNYLRVPVGASDFSSQDYSLDDTSGDTSFSNFNIDQVPSYVFSVLQDIVSLNSHVKIHLVAWSPPGWMKDSNSMNGGSLQSQYIDIYATYFLKAVQAFVSKGFTVHAVSIQNEPQNSNPTYPTCTMTPDIEGRIGTSLRSLLDSNGLSEVELFGYEHNWDDAGEYPVQLMQKYGNAFKGVSFHCYAGSVSQQDTFHNQEPTKDIYLSECSGVFGSDWWSDIKWLMDTLWIGAIEHGARAALMWNLALDGNGNPKLPGTDSCGGPGCRALVTVNNDGSFSYNQEFFSMAQASKAIIPKDAGGPFGQRIGVSVGGSSSWALRVGAYVTDRASSKDWLRYSLVVLNWHDGGSSNWDPQPVKTTIEFRGQQATFTFDVGVTTLWWFAPRLTTSASARSFDARNASVPGDTQSSNLKKHHGRKLHQRHF